MDIYQIWTTYNKPWSRREIAAFSVILIFTITGILLGLSKKKIHTIQAAAILAMVVFLGIVFASTVFTRTVSYIPCVGSNAWYGSRNRKGTADSGIKE